MGICDRGSRVQRLGEIEVKYFARLELSAIVTSWQIALALEPFHILQREVVRERFEYDDAPGIHVAFLRTFRLASPRILPELPAYGGCRSWVKLPDLAQEIQRELVLSDEQHATRLRDFREIIAADIASG